jgi:TfoX/Sxy family transcriptional regulator of competence genes
MGATWKKAPQQNVDFFNKFLEDYPDVEKRKMFGYPCAFLGGNMFFGLFEETYFLRLPEGEREKINSLHQAAPFEPIPGRIMKEYVALSSEVVSEGKAFRNWFEKSIRYAASLPAKEKKGGKK